MDCYQNFSKASNEALAESSDVPVHLNLLVKVTNRPIWHGDGDPIPCQRWPRGARLVVEPTTAVSTHNRISVFKGDERLRSPGRRDKVSAVPSPYTRHAVREVHPRTDQARAGRHGEAHLPYDDQQGEYHACSGRVAHKDDRCGEDWLVCTCGRVQKIEIRREGIEDAAWLRVGPSAEK